MWVFRVVVDSAVGLFCNVECLFGGTAVFVAAFVEGGFAEVVGAHGVEPDSVSEHEQAEGDPPGCGGVCPGSGRCCCDGGYGNGCED